MAARPLAMCVLLAVAGAARADALPLSLEINTLAVVHGLVLSAEPNASCATVVVQLGQNEAEHSTTACPDSSGTAVFALPLVGAHGRPARVVVTQPGAAPNTLPRVWQQLISTHGAVRLRVDMREAQQVPPAVASPAPTKQDAGPPPTAEAAPTSLIPSIAQPCACPRRTSTLLEDVGDRSLPTWLAAALAPAPTCPEPTPRLPAARLPTEPLPAALPPTEPPPSLLLPSLGAACALQAAALAVLLLCRRQSSGSGSAQTGDSGSAAPKDGQAHQPGAPVPHSRISLRDACTSPLVLLASPFVGRRAAAAALGVISEDDGAEEEEEEQQMDSRGSPKLQQLPAPGVHRSSFSSLPPPPTGWSRDTWGRLQRQSGGGAGRSGSKPAVQHPPPFGAAPGSAYRTYSEQ